MIRDRSGQAVDTETARALLRYGIHPMAVEDAYEVSAALVVAEYVADNDPARPLQGLIDQVRDEYG
jgi:phage tail sheath gpL-like